ncbi:thiamine pyrophosphate-dependent enzyme [Halorientalis brevis]|uniref:Thiamine pyrophosphate-dependent enzyme n=1 Tax=Halorientalis brevis TaxID=1126241 RepID=A0ABD6C8L9_9EURY|nr:thiamine pyrophosphate-dependent enzyme [Halorientalis brevis]
MHRVIGEREFSDVTIAEDQARELLAAMVRARVFDERALALQRRGWMSGYPPFRGQEASQVGAAHAMAADDWLFPTYRANAMQLARGVPPSDLLRFRRGHPEFHSDHDLPHFPQAIPIATQLPHAVGAGMAASYEDADHAVVAYFGDGATSEGDFHEACNFAGVFDAPVLFFCENNHWAISTARDRQTAAPSIAAKADAYGFTGGQVDGNDPLAVFEFVRSALKRVRESEPVLVESLTYRQGPHTTSDDPDRYRGDEELPEWRTRDPIDRFAEYLRAENVVYDGFRDHAREEATEAIDDAVEIAEAAGESGPDDVFEHAYADLSPRVREQRETVRGRAERDEPDR